MKQPSIKNRVDVVTLGCSKNLVDSELLMRQLISNGYTLEHDSNNPRGEIAIINTCGFIGDAKEESVNTILSFAEAKNENRLKKLYVMDHSYWSPPEYWQSLSVLPPYQNHNALPLILLHRNFCP